MFLTPEIISRLVKKRPGERTDPVIYYFMAPIFTGYWSFLQPKDKGIEISDVLLVWGDVCILVEAKTRESAEDADERWCRKHICQAIGQLNDRARMLRSGELRRLRNKWREDTEFDPAIIKNYYGLVIIQHQSETYEPREIATECFANSEIPIQVYSLADFHELLRFVNTPIDFIIYYELRHSYGKNHALPVHGEFGTYKSIILSWTDLVIDNEQSSRTSKEIQKSEDFVMSYTKAILRTCDATDDDYENVASGYLIDLAISSLSQTYPDGDDSDPDVAEHELAVEAAEYMAELGRQRRCAYGAVWRSLAVEADRSREAEYSVGYSPTRNRVYVFVAAQVGSAGFVSKFSSLHATRLMDKHQVDRCVFYCDSAPNT